MPDPGGVLGEIVARKRLDVAARLVAARDPRDTATATHRSLKAALAEPGVRFIMEVKRSSPSEGTLRGAVDPAEIARAYRGAADAISVLVDTPYFGGSLDDLELARAEFDGPILAKDFMIDVRQVAEARLRGADAILVMLSVLDDAEAAVMIAEGRRLGMDALVETHDEEEVRRAIALGAEILGINNRDLKTLKVDLAVTERLAGLVPADRLVVAESGIAGRADVERLAPFSDAMLVGSSLMRAEDPRAAARALAFGRVKVCGLTRAEDVEAAASSGATYGGLIMVPDTPRYVGGEKAAGLAGAAAKHGLPLVGVFRNAGVDEVASTAAGLGLAAVQLHGQEDDDYVARLRQMLPGGCELWVVVPMGEAAPAPRAGADRTLFDTAVKGESGGTGQAFDWSRLAGRDELAGGILAGGLSPDNARAASRVGAYALDVSSGVELAPGRKDAAKLRAFFNALRVPARSDGVSSCD